MLYYQFHTLINIYTIGGVIQNGYPVGLPLTEKLLPSYLQDYAYETHGVGKWHLGFYQSQYTPEKRGFDTWYGYYTGNEEYYNHTSPNWGCSNHTALDLHYINEDNVFTPIINETDTYSTNLFSNQINHIIQNYAKKSKINDQKRKGLFIYAPFEAVHGASSCYVNGSSPNCQTPDGDELQSPLHYIDKQVNITNKQRKTFAGMLGKFA